jgi:V8-like Glu-specific endopeptidase
MACAAACAPSAPTSGARSREAAIYYGDPENGYDGVVLLTVVMEGGAGAMCTGTAVAPRVIVTAKHCVVDANTGAVMDPSDIIVSTGPTGGLADYLVEDVRTTSGWRVSGRDFAVLILEDVIDATLYPYATDWTPHRGDPITLVGYGQRDDGGSGRKYLGENEVADAFSSYFTTVGESGCYGDSGGPAFDENGVLVGVIVNTLGGGWDEEDDSCASGYSGITRVDTYADIVDEAVNDAWVCDHADTETCGDDRDNDCNRLVDDGCLAVGDPCTEGVYCASGDCRELGGALRCTESCELSVLDACPAGFYCDEVACGEGACVIGEAGDARLGEACSDDTECRTLSCVDAGDGGECLRRCSSDDDCGDGERCLGPEEGCGGCAPQGDGSPFGAPCAVGTDCASGSCLEDVFGAVCTTSCTDVCPEGFECTSGQCLRASPGGADIGAPCAGSSDCASELCAEVAARGAACTSYCDPGNPCPVGFECVESEGTSLCRPSAGILGEACEDSDDCVTGLCGNFSDFRACTAACGESSPCPAGLVCQTDGATEGYCRPLEAPEVGGDDDGGCGCRAAGSPAGGRAPAWFLLVLPAALAGMRARSGRTGRKPREL